MMTGYSIPAGEFLTPNREATHTIWTIVYKCIFHVRTYNEGRGEDTSYKCSTKFIYTMYTIILSDKQGSALLNDILEIKIAFHIANKCIRTWLKFMYRIACNFRGAKYSWFS